MEPRGEVPSSRRLDGLDVAAVTRACEVEHGLIEAVLTHSPHGIIVCDAQGRFLRWNRAAETIWAGSAAADSIADWSRYRAFHPDGAPYGPDDWAMVRCLRAGESVPAEEVRFQRFDGTFGILLGSCAPIRDADGAITGALSVFADITEMKRIEQAERAARQEAEALLAALRRASEQKDAFLAQLSHELRNPLAAIRAALDLLAATAPTGPTRAHHILERQTGHLTRLVDDLLDVTRIERGKIELDRARVDLRDVVARAVEDHRPTLEDVHLVLDLVLPPVPLLADADATRVTQIVGNLLANASKFSPAGARVEVALLAEPGWATLRVRDGGIGFAPDLAERLFEPFVQLGAPLGGPRLRGTGGLGLGLALVRGLAELHGGGATAASDGPGRGATVTVRLPLAPAR